MKYYQSSWRASAAPIIARCIEENKGKPMKELRAALRKAYPFGMRRYHPYKIWLDEIRRQLETLGVAVDMTVPDVKTAFLGPVKPLEKPRRMRSSAIVPSDETNDILQFLLTVPTKCGL